MGWIGWIIVGVVVVLIIALIAWLIKTYNKLVKARLKVKNSWSQIDVQLKRKYELIPNLAEIAKGYAKHESGIFGEFAKARNVYQQASASGDVKGVAKADTYSARPGHSEHQTGLAMDLNIINDTFHNTKEAKWLASNCYKYGFILRYPKGKTNETGYKYESWHFRYVGKDVAKVMDDGDLSLEEYYAIYIDK